MIVILPPFFPVENVFRDIRNGLLNRRNVHQALAAEY